MKPHIFGKPHPIDGANKNDYRLCMEKKTGAIAEARTRPAADKTGESIRKVSSAELLGKQGELLIEQMGREYRLRLTQNGKLILTA
jgi:hemin uptake protein HemP